MVLEGEPVEVVVGCPELPGEKHCPDAVNALKFVAAFEKKAAQKLSEEPTNCAATVFPVGVQIAFAVRESLIAVGLAYFVLNLPGGG